MRRLTQLPNQIRIVTEELKGRDSVSVGVWVAAGGRYESRANKGAAHFLEHMVFKGSARYSCDEIKQHIEGVGGGLNAFTSEEETCYHAKVPARHFKRAFDVLADICFFPDLSAKDMDKERTVILEELKMYHDLPQYYVVELLERLLWPNHPLGENLAGTSASVSRLTAGDLRNFRQSHYVPANIVISACGPIKHEDLQAMVKAKLGRLTGPQPSAFIPARRNQEEPAAHLHYKKTEQMHLALGYLAYEVNHKDYYALALLNIILGGNMSSRLFNEVREKRGLAYSISSGMKSLHDTGVFMVTAGVDNHKITGALALILEVLAKSAKGIKEDEFKRAQEYYLGQFVLGLEDTMAQMLWIGSGVISHDHVKSMGDVIQKIKAVKRRDIPRVASEILAPQRLNVAVVGPLTDPQQKQINALAGL